LNNCSYGGSCVLPEVPARGFSRLPRFIPSPLCSDGRMACLPSKLCAGWGQSVAAKVEFAPDATFCP